MQDREHRHSTNAALAIAELWYVILQAIIAYILKRAVFASNVAPTSELGGLVQQSGGAVQYVVPNRSGWNAPVLIGTIAN